MIFGYFYDENGKFTEMRGLQERPKYKTVIKYRDEQKEIVVEEKLCEFHKTIEEGIEGGCIQCIPFSISHETIKVPYEVDEMVGFELTVPENCTVEPVPDLIFEPVFRDGHWVKMNPDLPPQPPAEPTEMEKLKKQTELIQKALDELIMG
ncbi:hypothetical protein [Bacillus toyonensis]|uniref:hypothetical protein n=1 Tax=Bacillus toyonensis TaxID=155322 RepID=UPI0012B7C263|nr:hypothetical protein [Bacillus toyonensis]KAB0446718.1 hypothetical protein CH334_21440 [Lysinibacillus sp. VIA-II-2016]MBF7147097.1 hypothetical protein [Bacillus toyonensis]MBG9610351.1 hypothetical protein [Bacillus toyonensis]MBG9843119.1 hypothetical protein [Bacillus toyonensis]MBG9852203.1 hypothetical protein [Bacillus toyonensis]